MSSRHALLALLSEGPSRGLQLREELEARTSETRPLNLGQVYTMLRRLEREGLVESDGAAADGPQKEFRITADGQWELAGWLRAAPELASPPHAELAIKILVALWVPGTDVHEVIQEHRRRLVDLMQQARIKEDKADHELSLALAGDAELFRLDSMIRWLEAAGSRLERAAASSPRAIPPRLPSPRRTVGIAPGKVNHTGASSTAEDRITSSDADRERTTARLCDHYAEGRLTRDELDERLMAALSARTVGDLRRVMADLPAPTPVPQQARTLPSAAGPRPVSAWHGTRILALAALALLGTLLIPGGDWPLIAFFHVVLVLALIMWPR